MRVNETLVNKIEVCVPVTAWNKCILNVFLLNNLINHRWIIKYIPGKVYYLLRTW